MTRILPENRAILARMPARWPQVRAVLVTLHIVAVALVALPAPSGSSRLISVDDPRFASEVHPWARLFHLSDEEFAGKAAAVRGAWVAARARVVHPFEEYLSLVGAQQPWHMFSTPQRVPVRLLIEARAGDGEWQWISGVPAGRWRPSLFRNERMRSLVNNVQHNGYWPLAERLCERLSADLFADEPAWREARCRVVAAPSPSWRARVEAPPVVEWASPVERP
jgi:hypothetical protein